MKSQIILLALLCMPSMRAMEDQSNDNNGPAIMTMREFLTNPENETVAAVGISTFVAAVVCAAHFAKLGAVIGCCCLCNYACVRCMEEVQKSD